MMFYGQCNKCEQRWELGTASTCKCPDFWEGYVPKPVKPAQQEPVACQYAQDVAMPEYRCVGRCQYDTSPPAKRTWVGLTDEERKLVRNSVGYNQFVTAGEYAEHVQKATEFKLKEKNT